MKLRSRLSISTCAVALLIGVGAMVPGALAQTAPKNNNVWPTGAAPADTWWFHGEVEAGGRVFLNNPSRSGSISNNDKSLAKYYEYSSVKPGPFSNVRLLAGSNNGLYGLDFQAKNIGYDDQNYSLDLSKAGQHYLSLGWDQTPHVYSTSAQTLYNGAGTTALTLPASTANQLSFDKLSGPLTQADVNRRVHQADDIGIRRDTASVDYRYTPTDNWDIKVAYSDMHRTGTQVEGVVMGTSSTGSPVSQVPAPVDDTTQNYSASGEYAGTGPWGKKFNFKVGYAGSTYTDSLTSYTVQNPSCDSTGAACLVATEAPVSRMSLWPSNQANGFTASMGADLPAKSRYMGTLSYTMMRQNDAFIPFSNNAGGVPATVVSPAASLNGAVNTLLSNNVLTTQITPELKSKLSYRYYDYRNDTALLRLTGGYPLNDTNPAAASFFNVAALQPAYIKQNAGAELNWRPMRPVNLGAAYGYEHYNWTYADVNSTQENSGKVFADWQAAKWMMVRASYLYGERRYDTYNHATFLQQFQDPNLNSVQATAYRQFMFSNRDRQTAKLSIAVDVMPRVTVTPTAGMRNDNYPVSDGMTFQQGLRHDHSWNAGTEISYVMNPDTTFIVSYLHEDAMKMVMQGTNTAGASQTDIRDRVDTLMFMVNYAMIPNKLDFTFRMTNSWAKDAYTSTTSTFSVIPQYQGGFPDVSTTFQKFDALAKYKIDPDVVRRLGWTGEVTAKLRYAWERNSVGNWQNDMMGVYMFTADNSSKNMFWMAYNNPNYNVHLLAASLAWKW